MQYAGSNSHIKPESSRHCSLGRYFEIQQVLWKWWWWVFILSVLQLWKWSVAHKYHAGWMAKGTFHLQYAGSYPRQFGPVWLLGFIVFSAKFIKTASGKNNMNGCTYIFIQRHWISIKTFFRILTLSISSARMPHPCTEGSGILSVCWKGSELFYHLKIKRHLVPW